MTIVQKAKDNPWVTGLTTIAAIAIAVAAILEGIQLADKMHFTHSEADVVHAAYDQKFIQLGGSITQQAKIAECRYLDDKITGLRYEIYVLKRDQASPDFIQSKETDLRGYQQKFDALNCATLV